MRGYVDENLCLACGLCAQACPEGFRMGEQGLAEGYRELPDYAIDDALQAAEDCPVGAIRVEK
ncbi:MAG: ferredoxin [Selenomonas sp.]|jgi:ferredoxin|nr:ferredoxin [Selenomonas sp.]